MITDWRKNIQMILNRHQKVESPYNWNLTTKGYGENFEEAGGGGGGTEDCELALESDVL